METFRAAPSTTADAVCGTVFDFVGDGMRLVPAVGIITGVGNHETLTVLTDPELVRLLIDDLTAGLTYLENAK